MPGDTNRFYICMPATWCKVYDFAGKTYTKMTVRLGTGSDQSFFVDVSLNTKTAPRVAGLVKEINSKSNPLIYASGHFANRTDGKLALKAGLGNFYQVRETKFSAIAEVSGRVQVNGDLTGINISHYEPLKKQYSDIFIPISDANHLRGSSLTIKAPLKSKLGTAEQINISLVGSEIWQQVITPNGKEKVADDFFE